MRKISQREKKEFGQIAEEYVFKKLSNSSSDLKHLVKANKNPCHYDLSFYNAKIETKSTQLIHRRKNEMCHRMAYFHINLQNHRLLLKEQFPYYALVLMLDTRVLGAWFISAFSAKKFFLRGKKKFTRISMSALQDAMELHEFYNNIKLQVVS